MRRTDYYHFMATCDHLFNEKNGIILSWYNQRKEFINRFQRDMASQTFWQHHVLQLKQRVFITLVDHFNKNSSEMNSLSLGIRQCINNLNNPHINEYHAQELVKNAELFRRKIMTVVEEERTLVEHIFSDVKATIPEAIGKSSFFFGLAELFESYFDFSDNVLSNLTNINTVLETKGVVQRWLDTHKPSVEIRGEIKGKRVQIEVHYSHDLSDKKIEAAYRNAEIDIFRRRYPKPLAEKMVKTLEELRRGGSAGKRLLEKIAQILLEALKSEPKFIMAPQVTYHLLIRSADRNWPTFAGACYMSAESTASEVCLNIGESSAINTYLFNKDDLRGSIAHELGHMLDRLTLLKNDEANQLAKELIGKEINEYDVFLFEFFNICRTEGYAEVLGAFHKFYDDKNPNEASFFFFEPENYRTIHKVNYLKELASFNAFLEKVMEDKDPNLFGKYFQSDECVHLRYRFGYLLYMFTLLGRLKRKNSKMIVLPENSLKKFRGIISKKDPEFLEKLKKSNKKLVDFCEQHKIKYILLGDLYDFWLKTGKDVYIFKPSIKDFEEVMTTLHHLSSHRLYLEYFRSCKHLGIPRDKMIFSRAQISRVVKVTSRVLKKKDKAFRVM